MTARRLALFAKEPLAGRVKTRLAARLGAEEAARLYLAFLTDLSAELSAPHEWTSSVAHAEDSPGPALARLFPPPWSFVPQGHGGLGERLARVLSGAGGGHVVAAGSDAPTLTKADVFRAFAALGGGADVVLAPSPDGGYALVGLGSRAEPERIFRSVRWSTPDTFADTVSNAETLGLVTAVIEGVPDVDVAEDLAPLAALLTRSPRLAPATRRALGLEAE